MCTRVCVAKSGMYSGVSLSVVHVCVCVCTLYVSGRGKGEIGGADE